MPATWIQVTDEVAAVRLVTDQLSVDVLPANGGDVYSVVDRATGIDLLWKAPWGTGLSPDASSTSGDRWLTRTWGGWQLLLPNTGDEAQEGGHVWGFHGEAGLRAWTVNAAATDELDLQVDLETAPLDVRRLYRLDGPMLSVTTTVRNRSDEPVEFLWGEHPTYGEAFATGATLEIDAHSLAVEIAAGLDVAAGDMIVWPGPVRDGEGRLDRVPPRTSRRFLFGFLDGLSAGTYRLRNERLGLSVVVSWPIETFPCVWLWEELTATDAAPWGGEAYAVGIEPQAAYPAVGMTELRRRGGHGLVLRPHESVTVPVTMTIEHLDGQI